MVNYAYGYRIMVMIDIIILIVIGPYYSSHSGLWLQLVVGA